MSEIFIKHQNLTKVMFSRITRKNYINEKNNFIKFNNLKIYGIEFALTGIYKKCIITEIRH